MGREATFSDEAFDGARTVARPGPHRRLTDSGIPHVMEFATSPAAPSATMPPADEDLHFLFDNSHELICIASLEGYFMKVNPAFEKTLGWSTRQLRSEPFIDFVHPDDRDRTLASMEALRHGQAIRRFENRYLSADGQYRLLSWNASPRGDKIYAVGRDVTLSPGSTDLQRQINDGLRDWFQNDGSGFSDATEKAKKGVTWLKWLGAISVFIFGAGVAYQQFFSENATKVDLENHVKNDLGPVRDTLDEVKTSVDSLVESEEKQSDAAEVKAELDKKLRRLGAYRAEYQEALSEYTASKASGKRATRPRKTQPHMDLEADLAGPGTQ